MPKSNDLFALPAGPVELCFDKNEFMKKTFAVDDFLQEHRNAASLEIMRDDLGIYLKVLRSAMIELINEDYADFVNLSSNLVGLDQFITTIQRPLEILKEDVLNIKLIVTDNINEINECLNQKKLLRNYKKNLQSLSKVQNSISKLTDLLENQLNSTEDRPIILERAALELIQLKFHSKFCSNYLNDDQLKKTEELHERLLEKIKTFFLNSLNNTNKDNIERCLRIYVTLDESSSAEEVFKTNIVAPYMNDKITESSLQNSALGLAGIYNQILDFISLKMKELLLLTHHTDKVKGFNFLINSFWSDVEYRLETNTASVFAPGNPDAFYLKYKCTQEFISRIETIIGNEESIRAFRQNSNYINFQSKWNLPVYFQIRFQEIAGSVESACDHALNEDIINNSNKFKMIPFNTAFISILKSWADGIYVEQLFPKFWKLTIQIISRLTCWIGNTIATVEKPKFDMKLNKIVFYVTIYSDGHKFIQELENVQSLVSEKMPSTIRTQSMHLENCINETRIELENKLETIEKLFIREISTNSSSNIRHVSDIPRLYRKTNRDVPSKPCSYVDSMLDPLKTFWERYSNDIGQEQIIKFLLKAFSKVTVQYYNAVADVLTSVQKTEESLRRLKNLREKGTTTTTIASSSLTASTDRQIMSDDDKIRLQLQVDVIHWTTEIDKFGIKRVDVEKLVDLTNLVEDATKIKISDK